MGTKFGYRSKMLVLIAVLLIILSPPFLEIFLEFFQETFFEILRVPHSKGVVLLGTDRKFPRQERYARRRHNWNF